IVRIDLSSNKRGFMGIIWNTRVAGSALAAAMLVGCGPAGAPVAGDAPAAGGRMFGTLAFEPCSLQSALAGTAIEAQCAQLEVAENPADKSGRTIALHIAWLPNTKGEATADPVFFLAGGPGQAATEHAGTVSQALVEVRKQR